MNRKESWKIFKRTFKQKIKEPKTRDAIGASALLGAFTGAYFGKTGSGMGAGLGFLAATIGQLKDLRNRYKSQMKEEINSMSLLSTGNIIKKRRFVPRGYGKRMPGKRVTSGIKIGAHNLIGGKKSFYQTSITSSLRKIKRKIGPTSYQPSTI